MDKPGRPEVLEVISKGHELLRGEKPGGVHRDAELHAAGNLYAIVAMIMAIKPDEVVLTDDCTAQSPQIIVRMHYDG